jgi:hypothetical protein
VCPKRQNLKKIAKIVKNCKNRQKIAKTVKKSSKNRKNRQKIVKKLKKSQKSAAGIIVKYFSGTVHVQVLIGGIM